MIDGLYAAAAIFPADSHQLAREIIDTRIRTRDWLARAEIQITEERNQRGGRY
jgi:hypothetical protein